MKVKWAQSGANPAALCYIIWSIGSLAYVSSSVTLASTQAQSTTTPDTTSTLRPQTRAPETSVNRTANSLLEETKNATQVESTHQARTCTPACTSSEFSTILQRILHDQDAIKRFGEIEEASLRNTRPDMALFRENPTIRAKCVRDLFVLIKNMASDELEMKNVLEFASDVPDPSIRLQMFNGQLDRIGHSGKSMLGLNLNRLKWSPADVVSENCDFQRAEVKAPSEQAAIGADPIHQAETSATKSQAIQKLVATVDHWLNSLERFTVTREWHSLVRVFHSVETILDTFVSKMNSSKAPSEPDNSTDLFASLKRDLPGEVMTLTSSLNNLLPWHVWPWNNIDLYTTVDTFLNHGIFAFSKTTVGPTRRIDFLPDMMHTLFKSFNGESFPKKCNEWSKIICDLDAFLNKLVLANQADYSEGSNETQQAIKTMSAERKNIMTQELTCIMFSSLSVQRFGGQDFEPNQGDQAKYAQAQPDLGQLTSRLAWDKQVDKALKLYSLAREALTNEQWLSIYNLINNLWSQKKISDRIIMVSRVVQLLTSCHMPREMLESALWKDIYKYKNAFNQLVDIIIEELNQSSESGKLSIRQVALGSEHLERIVEKFMRLLPRLIEAVTQVITDQLPELVKHFFHEKAAFFRVPCKGYSFSDIIPGLAKHREEILALEELICEQIRIKPNVTMVELNNLTNEFLAMAFNLTTFGGSITLPKMLSNPIDPPVGSSSFNQTSLVQESKLNKNVSSIIDEMVANPRMAKIVAIMKSSPLDPPEVHAELPELDWVEAGTSVALLYESIQKLLSYEDVFVIFPEVEDFQTEIKRRAHASEQMLKKFSKRDPIRLVAYSLDTAMPIALRTFKPMDSFNNECMTAFRDIFSEDTGENNKSTRQWQCFVSSLNFASWAINNFMRTLNEMFRNIVAHKSMTATNKTIGSMTTSNKTSAIASESIRPMVGNQNSSFMATNSCILFDGSVSTMLDNLPQFIDLSLETVLMASTSSNLQMTLYDVLCSSDYLLDPFNERSVELRLQMKNKMCHLFHKKSLENCAQVLKFDKWGSMMRELNSTWFEFSVISIEPSFREITQNVHEFLELFGRFRPGTMSDSLLAKIFNVNSFWTNFLNRTSGIVEKYKEKRFEYALQTLAPIIYDNLPVLVDQTESSLEMRPTDPTNAKTVDHQTRETLRTTILGARAVLSYLDKRSQGVSGAPEVQANTSQFESQVQSLFGWADQHFILGAEVFLQTIANNISKLESLFEPKTEPVGWMLTRLNTNLTRGDPTTTNRRVSIHETWARFCSAPIDKYLVFLSPNANMSSTEQDELARIFKGMSEGKEYICAFDWRSFYALLADQSSNEIMSEYPERQLTRIALTKWGQVLDFMLIESKHIKQLPKFFYMDYWQPFQTKLPQISPLKNQPSNLIWIWQGFEHLVHAIDAGSNQTSDSLARVLEQLSCGLDAVKGGLSWENIANIYQDKQDILAAHMTINNGFALAQIGLNTFMRHKKFQRFLDEFVKPRAGLNAFCELRNRTALETIFSLPDGHELVDALESFQELICDTNFETLAQNINPISVCYQTAQQQTQTTGKSQSLAQMTDRFFKLASLAVLDAKLAASTDEKPPILDKDRWSEFMSDWLSKANYQRKSGLALALIRAFQTVDSINSDHVIWKAVFKALHETSEIAAYLLRAVEMKQLEVVLERAQMGHEGALMSGTADTLVKTEHSREAVKWSQQKRQQQQLASTLSNIMFPEVNNFISFRTFKQLRYMRVITDFFTSTPGAQDSICRNLASVMGRVGATQVSRIELIGYQLNTSERLNSLMCNYHPSQWLTALNIVVSTKASTMPKKINYLTKYLSLFVRNFKDSNGRLESFIHGQQLEDIENVANTSLTYLFASSQSLKSLSFSKISNISWHSLPGILDSIDRHLCAGKLDEKQQPLKMPFYEPKKPDLETLVCKLPRWNASQVYDYLSENLDLHNMISLITEQTGGSGRSSASNPLADRLQQHQQQQQPLARSACVTPFRFASRWLKISQELVDEMMSKQARDKIKKCLNSYKKGKSICAQSLRFVRMANSLLSSINDLTGSDSWPLVKRTWSSISYLMLNHSPSFVPKLI